jgi:hypothetical protein
VISKTGDGMTGRSAMCQEDGKPLPDPIADPEKPLKVA